MSQTEHSDLVNDILTDHSIRTGLSLWKLPTGYARSMTGNRVIHYGINGGSDVIGIMAPAGRWLGIEAKVANDPKREGQSTFEKIIKSHGGIYLIIRRDGKLREGEMTEDQLSEFLDQQLAIN